MRDVGVDTVIAESGVAKATLYKHFPRKDDLVLAYLEKVDEAWRNQLIAAAEAAGEDPRGRLVGMFDALVTSCRREGYHGCAFINTAAESVSGTAVHARTVEHKAAVRAWVRETAVAAGGRPGRPGAQPHPPARRRSRVGRPRRRSAFGRRGEGGRLVPCRRSLPALTVTVAGGA